MPKESTVFVGVWTLNHDESVFKDAEKFIPERYEGLDKLASHYAGVADFQKRDKYPIVINPHLPANGTSGLSTPLHLRCWSTSLPWNAPSRAQHVEDHREITLGV
jgi:hypothetical protein